MGPNPFEYWKGNDDQGHTDGDGREVKKETPGEMHFCGEQQDLQRRTPPDDHGTPDKHRDTGYHASATNNTIGTETHRKKRETQLHVRSVFSEKDHIVELLDVPRNTGRVPARNP